MIHRRTVQAFLAAALALALALPATAPAVLAQDQPPTPEGMTWHLTTYASEGALAAVPWTVEATLLLEDGTASGSSGCNPFSGGYTLEGEGLVFEPALATTRMACPEPQASVEDGYLAALPTVATWALDGDRLALSDATGTVVLEYEQAVVGLTAADLAAIAARFDDQQVQIERLSSRLDSIRIGALRDRLNALEGKVKALEAARAQAEAAFTAAESVLLEAVPAFIRQHCVPRRSDRPSGTVAAVQCADPASMVSTVSYYLMESGAASRVWESRMDEYGVTDSSGRCWNGQKDKQYYTPGPNADGCYRDEGGRANLRYVAAATACKQLVAGDTRLVRPTLYIAVLGNDGDLRKLTRWAAPQDAGPETLNQMIRRPDERHSPTCPR